MAYLAPDTIGGGPYLAPDEPPASGSAVIATTVTLSLTSRAGVARIGLSSLKWAFFDQMPGAMAAPTAQGTVETTDGAGSIAISIVGTALMAGSFGWLIVTNSSGTVNTTDCTFSGPVLVA